MNCISAPNPAEYTPESFLMRLQFLNPVESYQQFLGAQAFWIKKQQRSDLDRSSIFWSSLFYKIYTTMSVSTEIVILY